MINLEDRRSVGVSWLPGCQFTESLGGALRRRVLAEEAAKLVVALGSPEGGCVALSVSTRDSCFSKFGWVVSSGLSVLLVHGSVL